MKIISRQFQILAENRHYKMANTFFYFFCHRLKLTEKSHNESAGNFFFFHGLHLNSAEKYLNETAKTFLRFGLHPKIALFTYGTCWKFGSVTKKDWESQF